MLLQLLHLSFQPPPPNELEIGKLWPQSKYFWFCRRFGFFHNYLTLILNSKAAKDKTEMNGHFNKILLRGKKWFSGRVTLGSNKTKNRRIVRMLYCPQ